MINILYTCTAGRYNNIVYKNINRRRCKDDRLFSSSRSSYFTAATSYTPRIRFLSLCFEYDIFLRYLCCTILYSSFFRGFLNASTWLHRARNLTGARDRAWIRCNFIIIQTLRQLAYIILSTSTRYYEYLQLYTYRVCGYAMMFTSCYVRSIPEASASGGRRARPEWNERTVEVFRRKLSLGNIGDYYFGPIRMVYW